MPLPPLPVIARSNFSAMSAKELRLAQEQIWVWISDAEAASFEDAPDDELLEVARHALNEIISERRALHSDESAPRGG